MNIAEILIKQILAEQGLQIREAVPASPDAVLHEDLLKQEVFQDALDLEAFRERLPDSAEEFAEQPEDWSVLGTYRHMAIPRGASSGLRNGGAYRF